MFGAAPDAHKYQAGDPPRPEDQGPDLIISPDTLRANRIPPGQTRTRKWPVLQYGRIPQVTTAEWQLHIFGLVEQPLVFDWQSFHDLPRVKVFADFHCVTRWSRLGNIWEGVALAELFRRAGVKPTARYLIAHGYDDGFTTNMPLDECRKEDTLVCDLHDGEPLSADHGGPVRLIIPQLYAWKSCKWLRGIELSDRNEPGFWEQNGYHDYGCPWVSNSEHPDGQRFS